MRILMVTFGYYPAVGWGGPVAVVRQDALELKRRGRTVVVCASNRQDKSKRINPHTFLGDVDGVDVLYLNTHMLKRWPGTIGPTWLAPRAVVKLWQAVGETDIVHVHGTRNVISMLAAYFALIRQRPLVLQPHGTLPHIVSSIWLKRWFDQLLLSPLLKNAAALIALQKHEVSQILNSGGRSDRVYIVPNGLSQSAFSADTLEGKFRAHYAIAPDKQIILFLARINKKKGADLLVEAFASLANEVRNQAVLVIAGPDDGHLSEVKALVQQYELETAVLFPGLLQGEDVAAAYLDADVFVLPCRVDTFPVTIMEACRAQTPIIVTETCEIADLIAGKAATVVPIDIHALSTAITDLLQDEQLRKKYQAGAAELMQTAFSIEVVGDKLESIYSTLVSDAE